MKEDEWKRSTTVSKKEEEKYQKYNSGKPWEGTKMRSPRGKNATDKTPRGKNGENKSPRGKNGNNRSAKPGTERSPKNAWSNRVKSNKTFDQWNWSNRTTVEKEKPLKDDELKYSKS